MTALRRPFLLLLATALVAAAAAPALGAGGCDPICCDEPCGASTSCACCLRDGAASEAPVVPAPAPAPAPVALNPVVVPSGTAAEDGPCPLPVPAAPTPAAPARAPVLRI